MIQRYTIVKKIKIFFVPTLGSFVAVFLRVNN